MWLRALSIAVVLATTANLAEVSAGERGHLGAMPSSTTAWYPVCLGLSPQRAAIQTRGRAAFDCAAFQRWFCPIMGCGHERAARLRAIRRRLLPEDPLEMRRRRSLPCRVVRNRCGGGLRGCFDAEIRPVAAAAVVYTSWNTGTPLFYASNFLDVGTTAFNSWNGVNDFASLKTANVKATQEKVSMLGPTASCGNSGDDQWLTVMVRAAGAHLSWSPAFEQAASWRLGIGTKSVQPNDSALRCGHVLCSSRARTRAQMAPSAPLATRRRQ